MICIHCRHQGDTHWQWCEAQQRVDQELTVWEREDLLNRLAQDLYQHAERTFQPLFPWVFVRILPKEQMYKGVVIAPAIEQNKPIFEGIVLSTWQPCVRWSTKGVKRHMESEFKVGDHVALPHWAGIPAAGFDADLYRVVREREWGESTDGGIFAKIEFEEKDPVNFDSGLLGPDPWKHVLDRYILIDRKKTSVTMSGR